MAAKTVKEMIDRYGATYALTCGLYNYFPVMNALSHIFYVDGSNGDDEALGLGQTPDAPLKSITKALSYCSDWSGITRANDYIFLVGYYRASNEVWPIAITKPGVHIIGTYGGGITSPSWISPPSTTAAITVAADGVELANLELGAGATSGGIEVVGNATWGLHIHHCRFGIASGMTAKNGIVVGAEVTAEMINSLIEDCRFGTLLTGNAIDIVADCGASGVKGTIIRNNFFQVNGGDRGINCPAACDFADGGIFDNRFEIESESIDGAAVYFASGAKGNVHNNYAWGNAGVALAHNPFFDAGSTNMSFGMNFRGAGEVATDSLRAAGTLATPTGI